MSSKPPRAPLPPPTADLTALHGPMLRDGEATQPDAPAEHTARTTDDPTMSSILPLVVAERGENIVGALGRNVREGVIYLGGLAQLSGAILRALVRPPFALREVFAQCEAIGVRSLPIAVLILFFVGLVFALQFGLTLQTMGAVPYIGKVTALSIMRELGPVFTALVVGGRVGAGIAAEIGSMRVTEQVDAIRALGADPVKKLVVPRVIAATLMLPLVSLFADLVGVFGGMLVSYLQFDLSMTHFYKSAVTTVHATDFLSGYVKPFFFGAGIAVIGCHEGLNCGQGTEGVGLATTRTVVNVSIMVVLVDFFLTKLFTMLPRI